MRTTNTRLNNWRRAIPGEDPAIARLMAMCTALTSELTVARERIDTLERLLEQAGVVKQADVEAYEPAGDAVVARDGLRKRILQRVFRAVKADAEREALARSAKAARQTEAA